MILNYIYFFEFYLVLNYCEDIGLQHLVLMDCVWSAENLQEMFEVKCRLSYFNFHKIGYTPKTKHQQIKQLPCQTIKKIEPYMEISYSFNRLNKKTYVLQDFQSIGQQQKHGRMQEQARSGLKYFFDGRHSFIWLFYCPSMNQEKSLL